MAKQNRTRISSRRSKRRSIHPRSPRRHTLRQASAKKTEASRYVYYFADGQADGRGDMKPLLGGKGANLAEMTRIGLPVPPGFTITTEVCTYFYAHNRTYPKAMQAQVEEGIRRMEKVMGTKFGDTTAMPLLVAVRSGARDSMPGMMDTILNLGRSEEHTSELQSRFGISYAVFCLKKKKHKISCSWPSWRARAARRHQFVPSF